MFGIDFLIAGTLLTLSAGQQQQTQRANADPNLCAFVKTAEINVLPRTEEVQYDTSKTLKQIQDIDMDTIDPYGFHGVTLKQGYMKANIRLRQDVKLDHKVDPRYDAVCIWYDNITVRLEIEPVIVIAREVYNDQCMRRAVLEHEMKHVAVDRKIVNRYAKIMGQKVYAALKERGFRAQPVSRENAQAMADRMQKVVFQILEHEYKKLDLDRLEQQRAVDNIGEYDSVSKECPDFYKKIPAGASGTKKPNR